MLSQKEDKYPGEIDISQIHGRRHCMYIRYTQREGCHCPLEITLTSLMISLIVHPYYAFDIRHHAFDIPYPYKRL